MWAAAPSRNIGAYGVEAKDVIEEVEVIDKQTSMLEIFPNGNANLDTEIVFLSRKPVGNTSLLQ